MKYPKLLLLLIPFISIFFPICHARKLQAIQTIGGMHSSSQTFWNWAWENRKVYHKEDSHLKQSKLPGFVTNAEFLASFLKKHKPDPINLIDMRPPISHKRLRIQRSISVPYTEELHQRVRNGEMPKELIPIKGSKYVVFYDAENTDASRFAVDYAILVKKLASGVDRENDSSKSKDQLKDEKTGRKPWKQIRIVLLDGGFNGARTWSTENRIKSLPYSLSPVKGDDFWEKIGWKFPEDDEGSPSTSKDEVLN